MADKKKWLQIPAYVTGSVNQGVLLRNSYYGEADSEKGSSGVTLLIGYHDRRVPFERSVRRWRNRSEATRSLSRRGHTPVFDKHPPHALFLVGTHARDWGVNPQKIGALGFSAGAHLAALLSNQYVKKTYEPLDEGDAADCRPDFVALIYPGLSTEGNGGTKLAADMTVSANTAPTFLLQAEDTKRPWR